MNLFTDVLFLFIYIVALLYFKIPDVFNNNFLLHKLYLFVFVFIYFCGIDLIKKLKNNCKMNASLMLQKSINMSLLSIIGYSIYVDMLYMDDTKNYFGKFEEINEIKRIITIGLIISLFVGITLTISFIFDPYIEPCDEKT